MNTKRMPRGMHVRNDHHGDGECSACWPRSTAMAKAMAKSVEAELGPAPIPLLLWCPQCHARHVDRGRFAHKRHHTHACQACGMTWRPAVEHTVGVQFLPGVSDGDQVLP